MCVCVSARLLLLGGGQSSFIAPKDGECVCVCACVFPSLPPEPPSYHHTMRLACEHHPRRPPTHPLRHARAHTHTVALHVKKAKPPHLHPLSLARKEKRKKEKWLPSSTKRLFSFFFSHHFIPSSPSSLSLSLVAHTRSIPNLHRLPPFPIFVRALQNNRSDFCCFRTVRARPGWPSITCLWMTTKRDSWSLRRGRTTSIQSNSPPLVKEAAAAAAAAAVSRSTGQLSTCHSIIRSVDLMIPVRRLNASSSEYTRVWVSEWTG